METVAHVALAAARGADAHELAAHVAADHAQPEVARAHEVLPVAAADVCDQRVRLQALEKRLRARPCLKRGRRGGNQCRFETQNNTQKGIPEKHQQTA